MNFDPCLSADMARVVEAWVVEEGRVSQTQEKQVCYRHIALMQEDMPTSVLRGLVGGALPRMWVLWDMVVNSNRGAA